MHFNFFFVSNFSILSKTFLACTLLIQFYAVFRIFNPFFSPFYCIFYSFGLQISNLFRPRGHISIFDSSFRFHQVVTLISLFASSVFFYFPSLSLVFLTLMASGVSKLL